MQLYGGPQWWSLTRECTQYILGFVQTRSAYLRSFRYTYIPDEAFFQTIIRNSPFKDQVVNDSLRYIDWESGPKSPRILTSDDISKILSSGKLFAWKFDICQDVKVLDLIDERR
jgi:hypothetical protein